MNLSRESFIESAMDQSVLLLSEDFACDAITPLAFYYLVKDETSFILESVDQLDQFGRYAFIGYDPKFLIQGGKDGISIKDADGAVQNITGDPLQALKKAFLGYRPLNFQNVTGYHGGAVGYLGYDMIRAIEDLPKENPDDLQVPDLSFIVPRRIVIFDLLQHTVRLAYNAFIDSCEQAASEYDAGRQAIEEMKQMISHPKEMPLLPLNGDTDMPNFTSNMTETEYKEKVNRAKEYIQDGEAIQVVLSQRFEVNYSGDALNLYRALRLINPSPYMFTIHFPDFDLVGSSPEILVREEKGSVIIRPIAGTRRRGQSSGEDLALEKELLQDKKETAEHVMLVDLARNDIGRVCEGGSVSADQLMSIERYSHVMHIVSNVVGKLKPDLDAFDLLRATFPAGTVSGAPKIRAMEIIDELETTKRGPYAGAVCYFDYGGNFDSCITIRTALLKDEKAYIQAGAGIVFDSVDVTEFQETESKAMAMMRALSLSLQME